jgi:hypothetical protein
MALGLGLGQVRLLELPHHVRAHRDRVADGLERQRVVGHAGQQVQFTSLPTAITRWS